MTVESGGTSPFLLLGAMIGLVGLAIAVFVVTLLYVRGQDKEKSAQRRVEQRASSQDALSENPPVDVPAESRDPVQRDEVMRVLYDPSRSRVLVEVEGRRYERLREIEDAQVGRRVLWAIADLVRFTGGMATNPRVVRSASEGVVREAGSPGAAPGASAPRLSLPPLSPTPEAATPSPAKLGQAMSAFFQRGLNPAPSGSAAAQRGSFIDQIEAILQEKLLEVDFPPAYEIHVSAGPEQRLQIQVGPEFYASIDEVPNLQARALIQAAVDEWERR